MKTRTNNVKIIKDEVNPETPELLAASLIKISDAMELLTKKGGIDNDGIAALVCNIKGMSGKVNKREVLLVMDALKRLKSYYIRSL